MRTMIQSTLNITTATLIIARKEMMIFLVIKSKMMKENNMAINTPFLAESLKACSVMIKAKWTPLVNF